MYTIKLNLYKITQFCLLFIIFFSRLGISQTEFGFGVGISPFDSYDVKKEKKNISPDPFISELSKRFDVEQDLLLKLWNRGYGRNELIKLLIITKKSNKDIKEIIKLRDKGKKLKDIAQNNKLEYNSILLEAQDIRQSIEFELKKSSQTIKNLDIDFSTNTYK